MLRRVVNVLASLNGGSMRKRLYVRLTAFALLIAASVLAIAQAQRVTQNRTSTSQRPTAAAKPNGQAQSEAVDATEPAPDSSAGKAAQRARPNPVPSRESFPPTQPPELAWDGTTSDVRPASAFGAPRPLPTGDGGTGTAFRLADDPADGSSDAVTHQPDSSSTSPPPTAPPPPTSFAAAGSESQERDSDAPLPSATASRFSLDDTERPAPSRFGATAPPLVPSSSSRFALSDAESPSASPPATEHAESSDVASAHSDTPSQSQPEDNPMDSATSDPAATDHAVASNRNDPAPSAADHRQTESEDDVAIASAPPVSSGSRFTQEEAPDHHARASVVEPRGTSNSQVTLPNESTPASGDSASAALPPQPREIDASAKSVPYQATPSRLADNTDTLSSKQLAIAPQATVDEPSQAPLLPATLPPSGLRTQPEFTDQPLGPSQPAVALPSRERVAAAPGPPHLQGVQTPSLAIEKSAPHEVQVGRNARFEISVRNIGQVEANDVVVTDVVPKGCSLVATEPPAEVAGQVMTWRLGALKPGAEANLAYTLVPEVEGELGSVAQVTFAAQASARTVSTRPIIKLNVEAAPRVLLGDSAVLVISIRNEGTGAARDLVVEEDVPQGLSHPAGHELENTIGILGPGEMRRLELELKAERPGMAVNHVRVHDNGLIDLRQDTPIEVVAPQLQLAVSGPTRRYLERQATYEITVTNSGTASARGVEVVAFLPRGLQFVSANKLGQYSPRQHAVFWNVEELPAQKSGIVQIVTLPVEEGEQKLRVESRAELDAAAVTEHAVRVESVAELLFTVTDTADPIEVGADTVYEIEVTNHGTKADMNIVLAVVVPDELRPLQAEGPTAGTIRGQQVQFEPVPQLGPQGRVVFRIQAKGQRAGDARIKVQLTSDQLQKPVSKEESTKVYSD